MRSRGPECTISVHPGESIQAAIDRVPEGAVVCLAEGKWREEICIKKSVTLRGQVAQRSVIRAKKKGIPVVQISSDGEIQVYIEKLTVTGARDAPGIQVEGSAQAAIIGSTISRNDYGIGFGSSGHVAISGNIIEGNSKYGILFLPRSTGEVRGEGNEMRDNGVDLGGNLPGGLRSPLVEPSEEEIIYPNPRYPSLQHAVDALLSKGRLILQGGEYEAGLTITKELTIAAQEGARVALRARSQGPAVLSLVGGAKLSATGLKVTGGLDGFLLGAGFLLAADAQATITGSTISGSEGGIQLMNSAQAAIIGSTVSGNQFKGIMLMDSAQATITGSTISGNRIGGGIELWGSAQATIIDSTISGNHIGVWIGNQFAIWYKALAQATIIESTISRNGWDGIMFMGSAQATIIDSTISRNGRNGIMFMLMDLAQATIEENKLLDNGRYGVVLNTKAVFTYYVTGKSNTIPGPGMPNGNRKGAVYPDELSFLMTEEGGELDRRPQGE